MNLPEVKIEDLLESGVHFGHNVRRWNPKMEEYIFGVRNNIHMIDLHIFLHSDFKINGCNSVCCMFFLYLVPTEGWFCICR